MFGHTLGVHLTARGGGQEPRQKVVDRETAAQMLRIALPRTEPHLGAPSAALGLILGSGRV